MTALFVALLIVHVAQSIFAAWRYPSAPGHLPPSTPMVFVTQTPMFILAVVIAVQAGAIDRGLLNPGYLLLGLISGHVIFAASVWMIHHSWKAGGEMLLELRKVWAFAFESPYVLSRFITVAVTEELIYRAVAQPVLIERTGSVGAGIAITAVIFSIVHHHFFRNSWVVSLEFLLFSILLGALYASTGSLLLVIVIHAIRDIEIAYLEFDQRLEEGESREEAIEAIEAIYAPVRGRRLLERGGKEGAPTMHASGGPQPTTPAPMEESCASGRLLRSITSTRCSGRGTCWRGILRRSGAASTTRGSSTQCAM